MAGLPSPGLLRPRPRAVAGPPGRPPAARQRAAGRPRGGRGRRPARKSGRLRRGRGRRAEAGAVEVEGWCHTADHVVVAWGADPVIPPIPGLHDLDGVWTNREVTGMKAVPRRLVIIGAGPVG